MLKRVVTALLVAALLTSNAYAYQITSHPANAAIPVIVINNPNGDLVNISMLPPPWNVMIPVDQGPGVFAYHWKYEDKQYGYAYLDVDAAGTGKLTFEFSNSKQVDGDTFTAEAVFFSSDHQVLAQASAKVGVNAGFGDTSKGYSTTDIALTPGQWQSITHIAFFYGKYQKFDDAAIGEAIAKIVQAFIESESEEETE